MKLLKKGDPCPCCGNPIPTDDPELLKLINWLAGYGTARDAFGTARDAFGTEAPPPDWAAHLLNRFTKVE